MISDLLGEMRNNPGATIFGIYLNKLSHNERLTRQGYYWVESCYTWIKPCSSVIKRIYEIYKKIPNSIGYRWRNEDLIALQNNWSDIFILELNNLSISKILECNFYGE